MKKFPTAAAGPSPRPDVPKADPGNLTRRDGAAFLLVALGIFLVVALAGSVELRPDVPDGMQPVNADQVWTASYWIVRGGPHLILEANKRTELPWIAFIALTLSLGGNLCWMGIRGRLKPKYTDTFVPYIPYVLLALVFLIWVILSVSLFGDFIQGKRVELDPVADAVRVDGVQVARFQDVAQFSTSIIHSGRGQVGYDLQIGLRGAASIDIATVDMREDTLALGLELNKYLAEMWSAKPAS
jgi:nitrate reductase NapE component